MQTLPGQPPVQTLVDEFLADQARMTAVERFSRAHDDSRGGPGVGDTSRLDRPSRYRDLLPVAPPGPGQQYAFEVDLDACSGCKACVAACHGLNGLDEGEAWRDVGLLVGTADRALLQPVTTGCHHCVDPGCLSGCPVDAYVKDDNGIVRHLDDQCIGCSYCTLTCPYEVPQYNRDRGIVRKCDLCHGRLAAGEAPACVQACPTEAIRITVVDVEEAGRDGWGFVSPDPRATRPATVFRSTRDLATDVVPADMHAVRPRHGHPQLVAMLVLTQLAIGAFVILEVLRVVGALGAGSAVAGAAAALGVTGLALAASVAHLGRPLLAWRAVLGLRHSWLSREIVAFGAFAPLGALHALAVGGLLALPPALTGILACTAGIVAVATSVMVYVATRRAGWRLPAVAARFGATAGVTGCLGVAVLTASVGVPVAAALAVAAVAGLLATTITDVAPRRHAAGPPDMAATRTARILRGPLAGLVRLRVAAGMLAGLLTTVGALILVAEPGPTNGAGAAVGVLGVAFLLALVGEFAARSWFFTAEGSPRMPGGGP